MERAAGETKREGNTIYILRRGVATPATVCATSGVTGDDSAIIMAIEGFSVYQLTGFSGGQVLPLD